MKYSTFAIFLVLLISVGTVGILDASQESLKRELVAANALQTKAEECALKASKLANTVDPRHYSESTTERVYKSCLED